MPAPVSRPLRLGGALAAAALAVLLSACTDPSTTPAAGTSTGAAAAPISSPSIGITGTGNLTFAGSVDEGRVKAYAFGVTEGRTIAFTVTSTAGDARISVIDPDGSTRATEEVSATFEKATAGAWTFHVTSRAGTARYQLNITVG
ncbi:hypothetical protein [Nocardia tengchongensis]|uniref:hypothetical protein n=1 Tax=Nocardia tengchongensis TaxID=2055889 RepID=UPI003619D42F